MGSIVFYLMKWRGAPGFLASHTQLYSQEMLNRAIVAYLLDHKKLNKSQIGKDRLEYCLF